MDVQTGDHRPLRQELAPGFPVGLDVLGPQESSMGWNDAEALGLSLTAVTVGLNSCHSGPLLAGL